MNFGLTICIAGILLNALGITFDFFLLNVIGSIATAVGSIKLGSEGAFTRKIKFFSLLSVPFSLLSFGVVLLYQTSDIDHANLYVSLGIVLFFYIYYTFYFTEALINRAQGVNELAATRPFRGIWALNCIVAFAYFFCYESLNNTFSVIAKAVFLLTALYYCFTIYNNSKGLFLKK